jgi:predicted type IV restriction endonuclease
MLTPSKKAKLLEELKIYKRKYLDKDITELDESGTRLMINSFLSNVLGYEPLEEIKTEYMIKGTYADYVIQLNGVQKFLVEVKAYSLQLSEKHLRQTINYGANEGIEWALLTNGRNFDLYKILFNKPIEARRIFSVDLSDKTTFRQAAEYICYLHKEFVCKNGLKMLWKRSEALDPINIAGIILSRDVIASIRRIIKLKYGEKVDDLEVSQSLNKIICEKIDPLLVRPVKFIRQDKKTKPLPVNEVREIITNPVMAHEAELPPALN